MPHLTLNVLDPVLDLPCRRRLGQEQNTDDPVLAIHPHCLEFHVLPALELNGLPQPVEPGPVVVPVGDRDAPQVAIHPYSDTLVSTVVVHDEAEMVLAGRGGLGKDAAPLALDGYMREASAGSKIDPEAVEAQLVMSDDNVVSADQYSVQFVQTESGVHIPVRLEVGGPLDLLLVGHAQAGEGPLWRTVAHRRLLPLLRGSVAEHVEGKANALLVAREIGVRGNEQLLPRLGEGDRRAVGPFSFRAVGADPAFATDDGEHVICARRG